VRIGPFQVTRMADKISVSARELGATGASDYGTGGEYNTILQGSQAIDYYEKMRREDGQIRSILTVIKAPLIGGQWYVSPASKKLGHVKQARFIAWALFERLQFLKILTESLNAFDYGHYAFEKVYTYDTWTPIPAAGEEAALAPPMNVVCLEDLAARHPRTWEELKYDDHGRFVGANQVAIRADGNQETVFIPKDKMLWVTFNEEAGDKYGISVLRPVYKHWYIQEHLYKVDAIQKERHALGIPTFKLPPGYDKQDKTAAAEMGRNVRTNEKAHLTLPPGWEFELTSPRNVIDVLKSIQHHNLAIAKSVLAQFLNMGVEASGSRALGESTIKLFFRSWKSAGKIIAAYFDEDIIKELIKWNFPNETTIPQLKVRRIGEETEWQAMSVALRNLIAANIIVPDTPLEEWAREEIGTPLKDPETERETPSIPGAGGFPENAGQKTPDNED